MINALPIPPFGSPKQCACVDGYTWESTGLACNPVKLINSSSKNPPPDFQPLNPLPPLYIHPVPNPFAGQIICANIPKATTQADSKNCACEDGY